MSIRKSKTHKVIGAVLGVALFFGAGVAQASALTLGELIELLIVADVIAPDKVDAARNLAAQYDTTGGTTTGTGTASGYTFTRNLSSGATGEDVKMLQVVLNSDAATQVAASGVGSAGNETTYFGSLTKSAVVKFQDKYASEVLTPVGLTSGTGYVGPSTRAKLNALTASGVGTGTGTGTIPSGTDQLTVSAASQPVNSLAVQGAARVPFTKFTVTAGSKDVTLNNVTVERAGFMNKAVYSGVVLLDQNGMQLGTSKTLNSVFQASVGETVVIPAGQSRTFTIAANMAASLASYAGEVGGLNVVGISASSPVSGVLPITGASHVANATLSIGSVSTTTSAFDPATTQTKNVGDTGVRISGIKFTAGTGEDLKLYSVKWRQVGTAGADDISNVVTVVDGTEYPATVSADGKYYTSTFGSGILIAKGNSVDMYTKVDLSGSNSASRTVDLDIDKVTDVYFVGQTYGFGIAPSGTYTPWFNGYITTINPGTATTIGKSSSVPAQNIAVNTPSQPLGAFETDFKGEPVTISGMTFTVATSSGGTEGNGGLTSVSVYDPNGNVVAGPIDASGTGTTLAFTDSVTFPIGKQVYTVKGKVPTGTSNGLTYTVTVTPSGWTSPVGANTGSNISLSSFGAFALNTMTVKAAALSVSVSPNPVAQNVVAGVQGFTFANYQFDASQSGEDVRFSSMVGLLGGGSNGFEGAYTNLTSCQIWDGTTLLNTGSNVVNPSAGTASSTSANTFTFDNALTISKGTVKTLALKCNLSSSAHSGSTYQWGIATTASNISVTGVTSGAAVAEAVTASNGQLMTVAGGTLVASEDSTSPAYALVAAGTTGVTNGVINFHAANEEVTIQRIGLTLTTATASSSSSDIVQVSLWDGATKVGSATFTGANTNATSTLSTPIIVAKDSDKDITVKVDLAQIGVGKSGTQGALVVVDIDTNSTNTQGLGESGSTINASGSTTFNGTRMFSTIPTVTKLTVPSTTLVTGTGVDIYRFSVNASSGGNGMGLAEINVNIATSTASAVAGTTTVTNLKVYAYTDSSFSTPVSGFTNGQVNTTDADLISSGDNAQAFTSILQIPAGETRYFRVVGDTTLTAGSGTFSGSVTTRISGDAAYPGLDSGTLMASSTRIQGLADDDFVWSPNATTTSAAAHLDWTNGYGVTGLPSDGTDAVTISK